MRGRRRNEQTLTDENLRIVRFGRFELDQAQFELRRDGKPVRTSRRVFDAMLFLAQRPDRVVTTAELIRGAWGGAVVGKAAVWRCIMLARKALGDDPNDPKLIVAVRSRGYRFVPPEPPPGPTKKRRPWKADLAGTGPLSVAPANSSPRPAEFSSFFGRSAELAALSSHWQSAVEGRGRLVLVTGDPGIGKSALVEQFSRQLSPERWSCWGRSREEGGAPSFGPWSEALRALCDSCTDSILRTAAAGLEFDLVRLIPTLARLHQDDATREIFDETPDTRFRVFESLSAFLDRLGSVHPILVVLEDLHAADQAALTLLSFLTGEIAQSRLMILGTCRLNELDSRPQLAGLVRSSRSSIATLNLQGLKENEVAEWLSRQTGTQLTGRRISRILRATNGHPFLIHDLLLNADSTALDARLEHLYRHASVVPECLGASFRNRLSSLPRQAQKLLQKASAVGREFSSAQLCAGSRLTAAETLGLLDAALSEHLVESSPQRNGWFRFSHDLVRQTIYGDLSNSARLKLHAQILADLNAGSPASSAIEIANHALLAVAACGVEIAVDWALRAMVQADRDLAHELSVDYGVRALETFDAAGDPGSRRGEVMLAIGRSQHLSGDVESANRTYLSCFEWSQQQGPAAATTMVGALVARLEMLRENVILDEAFHHHLRTALARVTEAGALRAQLLAARVVAEFFQTSGAQSQQTFRAALQMARDSGDASTLMTVINALTISNGYYVGTRETLTVGEELLRAATAARRFDRVMEALVLRARCLLELGEGALFRAERLQHESIARRLRYPIELWHCAHLDSIRALLDGDLEKAEATARAAADLAGTELKLLAEGILGAQLLYFALEKPPSEAHALLQEAERFGAQILTVAPGYQGWLTAMALLRLELGDAQAARDTLEHFVNIGLDSIRRDGNRLFCLAHLSRIVWRIDHQHAALALIRALEPTAGFHAAHWASYLGPIHYYLGKLWLVANDRSRAQHCFEQSIKDSMRVGSRIWRAWSEHGLSEALAESSLPDDVERRQGLLKSARDRAKSLRMGRLLYCLDHER